MANNPLLSKLQKLSVELEKVFLTEELINEKLLKLSNSFAESGIGFKIYSEIAQRTYAAGMTNGEAILVGDEACGKLGTIKISIWLPSKLDSIKLDLYSKAAQFANAVLKSSFMTEKSNLQVPMNEDCPQLRSLVFDELLPRFSFVGCVYADLDNFKQVNDLHSHDVGDRVLLEVGQCLSNSLASHSLALHRSGDEFLLVVPGDNPEEVILEVATMMQAIQDYDFGFENPVVGITCGLSILKSNDSSDLASVFKLAEKLTKEKDKNGKSQKRRGFLSLEELTNMTKPWATEEADAVMEAILLANLSKRRPCCFSSMTLNALALMLSKRNFNTIEETGAAISSFINKAISVNDVDSIGIDPKSESGTFFKSHSLFDIGLAVASGLSRSKSFFDTMTGEPTISVWLKRNKADSTLEIRTAAGEHVILKLEKPGAEIGEILLGNIHCIHWRGSPNSGLILFQIGHEDHPLDSELWSEIVVLDDRPVSGGGLPDFWQYALARLVQAVASESTVQKLIVWGNQLQAPNTVRHLQTVENWDYVSLADGLAISPLQVQKTAEILSGRIGFIDGRESLLKEAMKLAMSAPPDPKEIDSILGTGITKVFEMEAKLEPFALDLSSGCKVSSISEAYPVTLAIFQGCSEENTQKDQAGSYFIELTDFKIMIENPFSDMVPEYLRNEHQGLEDYYGRTFGEGSIFANAMASEDQQSVVVRHISDLILRKEPYSSRRAIIILPHKPLEGTTNPLGLTSLRVIPRFEIDGSCRLSFSFSWRTVEAIVGLPYSMYGSAKFAQKIAAQVENLVHETSPSKEIGTGTLSYLASSLHYFRNPVMQGIAERIISRAAGRAW